MKVKSIIAAIFLLAAIPLSAFALWSVYMFVFTSASLDGQKMALSIGASVIMLLFAAMSAAYPD